MCPGATGGKKWVAEGGERLTGPAAGVCPRGGPQWFFFPPSPWPSDKGCRKVHRAVPVCGRGPARRQELQAGPPTLSAGGACERPRGWVGAAAVPPTAPPPPFTPAPTRPPCCRRGPGWPPRPTETALDRNGTNSVYTEATTAPGRQKSLCCTPAACTAVHAVAGFSQGLRRVPPARGRFSGVHKSGTEYLYNLSEIVRLTWIEMVNKHRASKATAGLAVPTKLLPASS